jgi:hypothetical protein
MDAKPKRRWYQFSLRTMLLTMIVASATFGYWVHWSREWIHQRQKWIEREGIFVLRGGWGVKPPTAPYGMWLFGEHGVQIMFVATVEEEQEAKRLFPETLVERMPAKPALDGTFDIPELSPPLR